MAGDPDPIRRRWTGRRGTVIVLVAALMSTAVTVDRPRAAEPLRVGIERLPSPPKSTDLRLYTEEGFEADLAEAIARRLERPLRLVEVRAADRAAALQTDVDLILTRWSEAETASSSGVVATGYVSGLSVAMRSDTSIRSWAELAGRRICLSQGNERGRDLARRLGAEIREERGPARALMLVRTGECDAAIHDAAVLDLLFTDPAWQKFSATLPARDETALVGLVAPTARIPPDRIAAAVREEAGAAAWAKRRGRWAADVAFEVYLDQEGPDCH